MAESFAAVQWNKGMLTLLEQRKLPHEIIYLDYDDCRVVAHAITDMVVRGAPAIGIAVAYAVVLAARRAYQEAAENWRNQIEASLEVLAEARPTAVNLQWAITEMRRCFAEINSDPEPYLLQQAKRIHHQDIKANQAMGRFGAALIAPHSQVITHCNAGALATGGYGTALGVIRSAYQQGRLDHVYSSETRPWMQGARLTSWELQQDNIPVSLVTDSAVATLMQNDMVQWLIVGSDRIAANGDVANKIGTYSHAVNACYHGVKVMVVAPVSTIDMQLDSGKMLPIEHRDGSEITNIKQQSIAPANIMVFNSAFDMTPAELVNVIVTGKGVVEAPDIKKMQAFFAANSLLIRFENTEISVG